MPLHGGLRRRSHLSRGRSEDLRRSLDDILSLARIGRAKDPPEATQLAALVESAVQRQVEPLLERIEQMDNRLRFTDIMSGIFLIIGLAGIGLWARGRK